MPESRTQSHVRTSWPASPYHVGRSWVGHHIEDNCPCVKAPCGLVAEPSPDCNQHGAQYGRSMRQVHSATDCPKEK